VKRYHQTLPVEVTESYTTAQKLYFMVNSHAGRAERKEYIGMIGKARVSVSLLESVTPASEFGLDRNYIACQSASDNVRPASGIVELTGNLDGAPRRVVRLEVQQKRIDKQLFRLRWIRGMHAIKNSAKAQGASRGRREDRGNDELTSFGARQERFDSTPSNPVDPHA
jgi:hypothetical protein